MVNAIIFLVIGLAVAIWLITEVKHFKHKIVAIFFILLILSFYFSFSSVIKGKDIDLKTFEGMKEAGKLYFLWLGHAFKNVKTVTANAVDMNWKLDQTNLTNDTNLTINSTKV